MRTAVLVKQQKIPTHQKDILSAAFIFKFDVLFLTRCLMLEILTFKKQLFKLNKIAVKVFVDV